MAAMYQVVNFQSDQIAASQLAVDGQLEHSALANSVPYFQANPDCPDFLQLERRLWADELTLVPGFRRRILGFVSNEKQLRFLRCVREPHSIALAT